MKKFPSNEVLRKMSPQNLKKLKRDLQGNINSHNTFLRKKKPKRSHADRIQATIDKRKAQIKIVDSHLKQPA